MVGSSEYPIAGGPPCPPQPQQRQPADVPQTGEDARRAIRSGQWTGPTSGLAPGYVQGNLAILPAALASDFMRFCQLNPKPCPLLAAGAPGDPRLPTLGRDLDIRTDLCRYKVFRNGELVDEPTDIAKHWRDDLVIFALGCSFSFEDALMQDGIELRHITNGSTVPMYRTIDRRPRPPARSTARWWCRCGRSSPPTRSAPCRSPRAFPPCTARRCTSACRN